jgi:HEAT repeat protein
MQALITQLGDTDLWQRMTAESALRAANEDAHAALCALVSDADGVFEARWRAALLLGERGDVRSVPTLMATRRDPSIEIRQGAIWALGLIRDVSVFEALQAIFTDPQDEEQLRFVTASAMTQIDAARALPYLHAALGGRDAQRRAARAVLANLAERENSHE